MPVVPPTDDAGRARRSYAIVVVVALAVGLVFALRAPDRSAPSEVSVAAPVVSTTSSGGGDPTTPTTVATTPTTPTTTKKAHAAKATTTTAAPATTTTVDSGTLPQTDTRPTATGTLFDAGVQAMWQAIVRDDPTAGQSFFFPRTAYLQVKAISDAAGDYQNRLLAHYADDIHALHAQLGANASRAQLVGIDVPSDQAVWVTPGQEYNQLPYWRVYGSKLRYTIDGVEQSFPVTSLISWRGEWYVVHLGVIR